MLIYHDPAGNEVTVRSAEMLQALIARGAVGPRTLVRGEEETQEIEARVHPLTRVHFGWIEVQDRPASLPQDEAPAVPETKYPRSSPVPQVTKGVAADIRPGRDERPPPQLPPTDTLMRRQPMALIQIWFGLEGRISRFEYWVKGILPLIFISKALEWLLRNQVGWFLVFWGVLIAYPGTVIMAKRLHDRGRSGWVQIVPYVGAFLGAFLVDSRSDFGVAVLVIAGAIPALWLGIECGFLRGMPGMNRFGPPP